MSDAPASWRDFDSGAARVLHDVRHADPIAEVAASIRHVVRAARAAGHKLEAAWHIAGTTLGISPRRVRSYCDGSVTSQKTTEYFTVRQRMRAWMADDAARCEARAAELRAMLAATR